MNPSIMRWPAAMAAMGIAALVLASAASAQTLNVGPSPYTDTSNMTDISAYLASPAALAPLVQGSNQSSIAQAGSNNSASSDVTAYAGGGSYFGNVITQTQTGDGNVSNVRAIGNSNTLTATQNGSGNQSSITAYGSNNNFSSTQTGNGLSFSLQRVGNGQSIAVNQVR